MAFVVKHCEECGCEYLAGTFINEDEWEAFPGYDCVCAYCQNQRKPKRKLTIPGVTPVTVWGKKTVKK